MKDPCSKVRRHHLFHGEAGVIERRSVRVDDRPVGSQHDDGLRDGIGDPPKLLFVSPELIFSPLQIVDIRVRTVPLDHVAELIALRLDADDEPAVFAVEAPQTHFDLARLPRGEDFVHQFVHRPCCILRMDDSLPSPAMGLCWRKTRVVVPSLIEVIDTAVG